MAIYPTITTISSPLFAQPQYFESNCTGNLTLYQIWWCLGLCNTSTISMLIGRGFVLKVLAGFRISLKRGSCQIVSNLDPTFLPGTTGRTSPWWTISREQWKPSAPWAKIGALCAQLRWLLLFKQQDKQKFQTFCFQIKVVSFSDRLFGRWILFVLPRLSSELHWTR